MYLVIFLGAAIAGIGSLWLYQRRQRKVLNSVDGFRTSLQRISTHQIAIPNGRAERSRAEHRSVSTAPGGSRRPEPLDPARREAAMRRVERRRAARA